MTDLRTAAQQALEALESLFNWKVDPERGKRCGDAVVALRAALAQQAGPVAWSHNLIDNIITHRPADIDRRPDRWTPLCKCADTPPQRKPLTDEEIDALPWNGSPRQFARAIERAHNITDPQVEDRLARHGIPMPEGNPK